MMGVSIFLAFMAVTIVWAERWLGEAVTLKGVDAIEDRLFRRGVRSLLRGSAVLAAGAGSIRAWQAIFSFPQVAPGLMEELLIALAMLLTAFGGGQMLVGLWMAHYRFGKERRSDLSMTFWIVLVLGSLTAVASCLPLGVAWVATLG